MILRVRGQRADCILTQYLVYSYFPQPSSSCHTPTIAEAPDSFVLAYYVWLLVTQRRDKLMGNDLQTYDLTADACDTYLIGDYCHPQRIL